METARLPPHKAAALRRQAEKEKAEMDRLVENMPPYKAAAVRKQAAKKNVDERIPKTIPVVKPPAVDERADSERALWQPTIFRAPPPTPPSSPPATKLMLAPVRAKKAEQTAVSKRVTTLTTFRQHAATNENDTTVALTEIEEIERDIEMAKTAQGIENHATSLVLYENAVEGASFAKLEADFDLERSLAQTASLRLSVEPLNKDFTKHDLERLFGNVGQVATISLYADQTKAFVLYHSYVHAIKAVERFHGKPANGQTLTVKFAWQDRSQLFREGNYEIPYRHVKSVLQKADLWDLVKEDRVVSRDLETQTRNAWAINHILSFVSKRLPLRTPVHHNMSGFQLLENLREQCRPFRLMDLDFDIRKKILQGMVKRVLNSEYEVWPDKNDPDEHSGRSFRANAWFIVKYRRFRHLSSVSREFRETLNEIFFSQNNFQLCTTNLDIVQDWVKDVGIWRLRHLQQLYLDIAWSSCGTTKFEVTYDETNGLKATCIRFEDEDEMDIDEYVEMIERRKLAENWESTGVVEFFTIDQEALRESVWGILESHYEEDEDEEIDERDAYQVAYGRSYYKEVRRLPW